MLALGAVTHFFDQNLRFAELFDGESGSGVLVINGPLNASVAPPGDYLLFALRRVRAAGEMMEVPSVARVVRVRPEP
jgi:hypothetical protein